MRRLSEHYYWQVICFRIRRVFAGLSNFIRTNILRLAGAHIAKGASVGRIGCNWPSQLEVGEGTVILDGAVADYCWGEPRPGPSIIIGSNTYVGRGVEFNARSRIEIGNDCLIAAGVRLIDHDHGMQLGSLMRDQAGIEEVIVVGNDVWIGVNAVVLKGVTIGNGAVIAAGAIVTINVPENEIWGGVPARKLRSRN